MLSPAAFRFVDPGVAQQAADMAWFQIFDDQPLQNLIKEGIANNLDLQMAVARVEESRARAGIARSYLYPEVNAGLNYTARQATKTPGGEDGDTTNQTLSGGFQLSWEIDLFGKLRRQHEASLAIVLANDQGRRGVLVTLVGDIAANYFRLRELDLRLGIARRTLAINDETVGDDLLFG